MIGGSEKKLLGRWGEALVAEDLRKRGWTVLAAGWQCRFGELDLVAEKGNILAFVEVKLRKNDSFAAPRELVDRRKQERIRTAAELYLSQNPTSLQPRFDVAEVFAPMGMETVHPRIIYIENAF